MPVRPSLPRSLWSQGHPGEEGPTVGRGRREGEEGGGRRGKGEEKGEGQGGEKGEGKREEGRKRERKGGSGRGGGRGRECRTDRGYDIHHVNRNFMHNISI